MSSTHTQSRPSWSDDSRITWPGAPRESWTSSEGETHETIVSPAPHDPVRAKNASSMSPRHTSEIVESLQTFVERMQTMEDVGDGTSIMDNVRKFARKMQQKVAKLGGVASQPSISKDDRHSRPSIVDGDTPDRPSFSCSLDGYRPDIDVVAPISVRPNAMELLWVCGDCGEHYPRARQCPESCKSCGAPKQNFYAPIED